ncbi:hypothetical protein H9P43_001145 [Blastocladiella emersonii ATCC 22665]|nr:hypothetical protein H9P43_001145 [Blastocladiella emersonii ATCC 22665]
MVAEHVFDLLRRLAHRHGFPKRIITNNGSCGSALVANWAYLVGSRLVNVTLYNLGANGGVGSGHKPLIRALAKLSASNPAHDANLTETRFADRCMVRESTGRSLFELVPAKVLFPTWDRTVPTSADVALAARSAQIQAHASNVALAAHCFAKSRANGRVAARPHQLRDATIQVGDLVLQWDHEANK